MKTSTKLTTDDIIVALVLFAVIGAFFWIIGLPNDVQLHRPGGLDHIESEQKARMQRLNP